MTYRALSLFREKIENGTRVDEFMNLMNLFCNSEYVLGKENLEENDCSGLVCGTLTLMGNEIRINANDIMNLLTDDDNSLYDPLKVKLVFFCDDEKVAKHVGILCDNSLVFHSSHPKGACYESLKVVSQRYGARGFSGRVKMLNFSKVDENTGLVYDLDEELS